MLPSHDEHAACVHAWYSGVVAPLPRHDQIELFEMAMSALWQRVKGRLSDVTLMAIADRVLHDTRERFPLSGIVGLGERGIHLDGMRLQANSLSPDEIKACLCFLLVEFLRIVGRLTAEVLTPALHAELRKVRPAAG